MSLCSNRHCAGKAPTQAGILLEDCPKVRHPYEQRCETGRIIGFPAEIATEYVTTIKKMGPGRLFRGPRSIGSLLQTLLLVLLGSVVIVLDALLGATSVVLARFHDLLVLLERLHLALDGLSG